MAVTIDGRKVGIEEYRASIGMDDGVYIETVTSRDFPTARAAEAWGLHQVRTLNARKDGSRYDARIEHIRWVPSMFDDDQYGTVYDGTIEYDTEYNSYCDGVTWHDDHGQGGPRWEA